MIERLLAAERALAAGEVDQAERLFGQVAEADERNAIAVVGLAEVARARGDDDRARELARRALAIDPDDAAAARLLAAAERAAEVPSTAEAAPATEPPPPSSVATRLRSWLRRLLGRRA